MIAKLIRAAALAAVLGITSGTPALDAAPARAPRVNGLGPNGLTVNWFGPQGLGLNWFGPQGLSGNWSGPQGLSWNWYGPQGLSSNWFGPQGIHPGALPDGTFDGSGTIDAPGFAAWFRESPEERSISMTYLVRCAYAAGTTIRWVDQEGRTWSWRGQLGLAQRTFLADQRMDADEGRWVSACLLAHVNTLRTHQYISLRGNPPGHEARAALTPTAAERWTMGYEEGVFAGDLFDGAPPSGGFTFSLNVTPGTGAGAATWLPPNAVLGRTLAYEGLPADPAVAQPVSVSLVGTYALERWRFSVSATPVDPDHLEDAVCLGSRRGDGCDSDGAAPYRPLFVHLARLANFEDAVAAPAATPMIEVLDAGVAPLDRAQARACSPEPSAACIGGAWEPASGSGPTPGPGAKLVGLREGQVVAGVLRFGPGEPDLPIPPLDQPYTAIVRYASAAPAQARVRVSAPDGSLRDVGVVEWQPTGSADRYEWLQVYPVYATPDATAPRLRIEIGGTASGAAPELDAVGFVPGRPWCAADDASFARNCPR